MSQLEDKDPEYDPISRLPTTEGTKHCQDQHVGKE